MSVAAMLAILLTSNVPCWADDSPDACRQLRNAKNLATFAQIREAPTVLLSVGVVPAGGDGTIIESDFPEICRVEGSIAPSIGFLVRMPTKSWNGKFIMGGCGGACGQFLNDRIDPALIRGYAVVVTDMGHKGNTNNHHLTSLQGQVDFGYRATHATAVAAKVIVETFYGRKPARNYFFGCSTGGGQALLESQLFPNDFEAIVAGAPAMGGNQFGSWRNTFNVGPDGKQILSPARAARVHQGVLAACDANDGLKDGLLLDPLACKWDPASIQCKADAVTAECLSADEVRVVRLIFDGPRNAKGVQASWGIAPRGSESVWAPVPIRGQEFVTFSVLAVPDPAQSRMSPPQTEPWFRFARNPDLRPFREAGGKLILFTGLADNQIPPGSAIDYYDAATRQMGGEKATKEFFRFFLMPDVLHCRYGEGGGEVDWLSYMENWVEKNQAPDSVIAYHMVEEPYPTLDLPLDKCCSPRVRMARHPLDPKSYDRARPIFAYPDTTRYAGKGDPKKPESWIRAPRPG